MVLRPAPRAEIQEILYRRIGNNENGAIEVLETLIDAQKEYASTTHDDEKMKHYASKLFSTEGKHDGLYWKTADNEAPSPIGPLICRRVGRKAIPGRRASRPRSMATSFAFLPARDRPRGAAPATTR